MMMPVLGAPNLEMGGKVMEHQLGEVLSQLVDALQGSEQQELGNLVKSLYGDIIEGSLEEKDRQTLQKLMKALETNQVRSEK